MGGDKKNMKKSYSRDGGRRSRSRSPPSDSAGRYSGKKDYGGSRGHHHNQRKEGGDGMGERRRSKFDQAPGSSGVTSRFQMKHNNSGSNFFSSVGKIAGGSSNPEMGGGMMGNNQQ